MEYIESIFYRKINPSDFKKMFDIDKPETGGGQTYLEAAGIDTNALIDFLSYGEMDIRGNETRYIFTINAYVLGLDVESTKLEFAPRGNRINYRISRQTIDRKHPAWRLENGFPEPNRDENGKYSSDDDFVGIIDDLIIVIIRTNYKKYYASFINSAILPISWPQTIGLNSILEGKKRGILNIADYQVPFRNSKENPFASSPENREPAITVADNRILGGCNILLYGVPGSGKSHTVKNEYCNSPARMERVVFHPDYTYSDFVGQILPKITGDRITYEFIPGPFTKILEKAVNNSQNEYYLIIEEINRGNAPAIFGEVFQLLDRDEDGNSEYGITNSDVSNVVYDDENRLVSLPSNLFILATMNTSDQNVFTLDTAFQRRWRMRMIENDVANSENSDMKILDTDITWKTFNQIINSQILEFCTGVSSAEDKRLGAYFIGRADFVFNPDEDDTEKDEAVRKRATSENSRFSEKVLKYLWDDAFKFCRSSIFIDQYRSLEELVKKFNSSRGNERFSIFKSEIFVLPNITDQ